MYQKYQTMWSYEQGDTGSSRFLRIEIFDIYIYADIT